MTVQKLSQKLLELQTDNDCPEKDDFFFDSRHWTLEMSRWKFTTKQNFAIFFNIKLNYFVVTRLVFVFLIVIKSFNGWFCFVWLNNFNEANQRSIQCVSN